MNKPTAVMASDVHYSIQTLELADNAMRQAIAKSNELQVPLVVAGDLHDTKANMRGECVKAMLDTFGLCTQPVYILRGNHDAINERSKEHSLEFLRGLASIVVHPTGVMSLGSYLIPYEHDTEVLKTLLSTIPSGSRLIMHQGVIGSNSGDYIQDKSALPAEYFKDFRVISGHYHTRQDIKTGRPRKGAVGLFSYIGNPYSLTFGEANDPEKGFQIFMDDGTLEFVPTNLRKHIKLELTDHPDIGWTIPQARPNDLIWVRVSGTRSNLQGLNKKSVGERLYLTQDFRFETIPTDSPAKVFSENLSQPELLDSIVDASANKDQAARLKSLWRTLCE